MGDRDQALQENWPRVFESLDEVKERLKEVERSHRQLQIQTELAATVVENAAVERTELYRKVEETGKVVAKFGRN
jgi:hypothetical protein